MFGPFRKEKPLQGFMGFGGGAAAISKSGGAMAPQIEASGGSIHDYTHPDGNLYRHHVFFSPATFEVSDLGSSDGTIHYLVVAGGGQGGNSKYGGGGGAGGMRTNFPDTTANPPCIDTTPRTVAKDDSMAVVVGRGGQGPMEDTGTMLGLGHNSSVAFPWGTTTCYGGGGGGGRNSSQPPTGPTYKGKQGDTGGCGGGGSYASGPTETNVPGGTGTQGYPGGPLGPGEEKYFGSGGGGCGGAGSIGRTGSVPPTSPDGNPWNNGTSGPFSPGESPFPFAGGVGGIGARIESIECDLFGTPGPEPGRYFAGGGAGGTGLGSPFATSPMPGNSREGGAGGGGRGTGDGYGDFNPFVINRTLRLNHDPTYTGPPTAPNPNALNCSKQGGEAVRFTGSGGGGAGEPGGGGAGGPGAPGICIIRYIISPAQTAAAKATGGLITAYNGQIIHTFFQPGPNTFGTPPTFNETCEYVIVGGGGAGAGSGPEAMGGGGGAGGYLTGTTPVGGGLNLEAFVGDGGPSSVSTGFWWNVPSPIGTLDVYLRGGSGSSPGIPSSVNFPAGTVIAYGGGRGGRSGSAPGPQNNPYFQVDTQTDSPTGPNRPAGSGSQWNASIGEPGGSGGGNSDGGHTWGSMLRGVGSTQTCRADQPVPSQGYPGGYVPSEDANVGSGGGGAGGAAPNIPTTDGRPGAQTAGNGGIGVQLPTTFRNPKVTYGPGPSQWYMAGGGCGGAWKNPPTPDNSPTSSAPVQNAPGGGGGSNENETEGNRNAPGIAAVPQPSSGVICTGSGGGGASTSSPTLRYCCGGLGGSGIILIAYPA